ncbi:unnamed protein product [Linum trigynum]|uniref:ADP-ribosyl cyclase/cyclic ADP-ribose hydrolase n=1 Tax=Linum trigynum TaxID=586398 RepID=A0AAV2EMZ1_9ROSI
MGKLGNKREMDCRRSDRDDGGNEAEQLAPTLSRPSKRQKKLLITTNELLTKLCNWLRDKFIRPPPFSSSDLIPFNKYSDSGFGLSKYDVFISFRGADVRNSFLSHLYYHLNHLWKLAVYKDDVDMERGEQISSSLLLAVQRSDVYIVILFKN